MQTIQACHVDSNFHIDDAHNAKALQQGMATMIPQIMPRITMTQQQLRQQCNNSNMTQDNDNMTMTQENAHMVMAQDAMQ